MSRNLSREVTYEDKVGSRFLSTKSSIILNLKHNSTKMQEKTKQKDRDSCKVAWFCNISSVFRWISYTTQPFTRLLPFSNAKSTNLMQISFCFLTFQGSNMLNLVNMATFSPGKMMWRKISQWLGSREEIFVGDIAWISSH